MNINTTPNPISDYYIAYFDILGYKQFFNGNPHEVNEFLGKIHNGINETIEKFIRINSTWDNAPQANHFQHKTFSDNILVCLSPLSGINVLTFVSFLNIIAQIQYDLTVKHELLIRGGITIGEISFNDNYVFGKGLIRVVELESEAKSPRIVIDTNLHCLLDDNMLDNLPTSCESCEKRSNCNIVHHKVLNNLKTIKDDMLLRKFKMDVIEHDLDGKYCLSYLNKTLDLIIHEHFINNLPYNPVVISVDENYIQNIPQTKESYVKITGFRLYNHRNTIVNFVNQHCNYRDIVFSQANYHNLIQERQKVICKYTWLLNYHNDICERYGYNECQIPFLVSDNITVLHDVVRVINIHIIEDEWKLKDKICKDLYGEYKE